MNIISLVFIELDNPKDLNPANTVLINQIDKLKDDVNKVESYINILEKKQTSLWDNEKQEFSFPMNIRFRKIMRAKL